MDFASASPAPIRGRLFGPGPSTGEEVTITVHHAAIVAASRERRVDFPFALARFALGGARDEQIVLERDDPAGTIVLYVERAALAPELARLGDAGVTAALGALGRGQTSRRRRTLLGAGIVLLALGAFAAVLVWLVGVAVSWGLSRVPKSWEVDLGRSLMASTHDPHDRITDPAVVAPIDELFQRLVTAAGDTGYSWQLHIVRGEEVNAFALPGGSVAVYSGLIAKCRRPEELAGVLAHEVQHVLGRHSLALLGSHLKWQLVLSLLVGDLGSVQSAILGQSSELLRLANSRDAEREADERGLALLVAAGIDPEGMASFFEVLAGQQGAMGQVPTFLSTHPGSTDRAARMRELIARQEPAAIRPLELDWAALQARLKAPEAAP